MFASPEKIAERLKICNACEHKKPGKGILPARCGVCGCVLMAKTRLEKAKCADKKAPKW